MDSVDSGIRSPVTVRRKHDYGNNYVHDFLGLEEFETQKPYRLGNKKTLTIQIKTLLYELGDGIGI